MGLILSGTPVAAS